MRRGLMDWDAAEVTQALLGSRIDAVLAALANRGFDALIAYADFTRPQALSELVHFVPYWSNMALIVSPDDRGTAVATLSRRGATWLKSVSNIRELINAAELGTAVAQRVRQTLQLRHRRLAVVDLASVPAPVIQGLAAELPDVALHDAGDWFDALMARHPAPAVRERAVQIARQGLAAALAASAQAGDDGNALIAAADSTCRLQGAEEVLVTLAPDMRADPRLQRVEGGCRLNAPRLALQLSLAYKGHWIRLAQTLQRGSAGQAARPALPQVLDAFERQLQAGAPAATIARDICAQVPGASVAFWRVEGARGGLPLATLADSSRAAAAPDAVRSGTTVSLRLSSPDGWWHAAHPA